jgi:hypothetical protein
LSARQIEACAQRLPPMEALQFTALMRHASALHTRAGEYRRLAWAIYRSTTGLKKRAS